MADEQEELPEPDPQHLLDLLDAFVAAQPKQMRVLLDSEARTLLHPAAEDILHKASREAATASEHEAARALTWHANLLAACREHGVSRRILRFGAALTTGLYSRRG